VVCEYVGRPIAWALPGTLLDSMAPRQSVVPHRGRLPTVAAHVCETRPADRSPARPVRQTHRSRTTGAHSAESRWSRPDVAGASPVPCADVAGASPVPVQMWQGRAQSRCRCGRGEPSPVCRCGRREPQGVSPVPAGRTLGCVATCCLKTLCPWPPHAEQRSMSPGLSAPDPLRRIRTHARAPAIGHLCTGHVYLAARGKTCRVGYRDHAACG
jgi:hypothetical protein